MTNKKRWEGNWMVARRDIEGNVSFNKNLRNIAIYVLFFVSNAFRRYSQSWRAHQSGLGAYAEYLCTKQRSPQHDVLLHLLGYQLRLFDYQEQLGQGYRARLDAFTTFNA